MSNEREQFEAHYHPQFHPVYFSSCNGVYADETMQARWMAWQARAALSAPPAGLGETDIYDFAGWLTARPGMMPVGASSDAAQMAEAVGEYIKAFPQRFGAQPTGTCVPVPRQVLLDTIAQLWERALGEEDCPLCGSEGDELHDNGCLLGMLQRYAAAPQPPAEPPTYHLSRGQDGGVTCTTTPAEPQELPATVKECLPVAAKLLRELKNSLRHGPDSSTCYACEQEKEIDAVLATLDPKEGEQHG